MVTMTKQLDALPTGSWSCPRDTTCEAARQRAGHEGKETRARRHSELAGVQPAEGGHVARSTCTRLSQLQLDAVEVVSGPAVMHTCSSGFNARQQRPSRSDAPPGWTPRDDRDGCRA
jgi:hypothetical protein